MSAPPPAPPSTPSGGPPGGPPGDTVLDLFAVPGPATPLPGGAGRSVVAGDLVLSPGRDPDVSGWLSPLLARLAVHLDEHRRSPRDLRIAVPVPARDGSWVVDGWGASRYEPGSRSCVDLDVLVATGRHLHARLAVAFPGRPAVLAGRDDRWAAAERVAFGDAAGIVEAAPGPVRPLLDLLGGWFSEPAPEDGQLVHADLAGNVLLDAAGAPVVIDLSPAWRPARWAEAVCVLDAELWLGAPAGSVQEWAAGSADDRDLMARAAAFRLLSDRPADVTAYARVLGVDPT